MTVAISAALNGSTDSPGVDLTITGLSGFTNVSVVRVDTTDVDANMGVRGLDQVTATSTMTGTDFEAPINRAVKYQATAYNFNPQIEFVAAGAASAGTTSLTPAYPAGTAAADTNIMFVEAKPYTATVATPTGWTLISSSTNGTTASGVDTGSTVIYAFRREGTFGGTETVTVTSANTAVAQIVAFRKTVVDAWSYSFVSASDSSNGADFSATSGSTWTPQAGDMIVTGIGINSDAGVISNVTVLSANTSISVTSSLGDTATTIGDDSRLTILSSLVGSLVGTGAASVTFSNASSTSGTVIFVRLSTTGSSSQSATSNIVTIPYVNYGDAWIKSVGIPVLSRKVQVSEWNSDEYPPNILGNFHVLGAPNPVIITDQFGARSVTILIATDNSYLPCTWLDLYALCTQGGTLLIQTADYTVSGEKDMFCEITSLKRDRKGTLQSDGHLVYIHSIALLEVDRPTTAESSLGLRTYQDVINQNTTYQDVLSNYSSYLDLLIRSR